MTDPKFRTKLKEEELQAIIMARLCKYEECSGIIQVYVRPTGDQPPAHTWVHTLVSRRTTVPRSPAETKALDAVLSAMRDEFDLITN